MNDTKTRLIAAGLALTDETSEQLEALDRLFAEHGAKLVQQWNRRKAATERANRALARFRAENDALDKHPGILGVRRERAAREALERYAKARPGRFFYASDLRAVIDAACSSDPLTAREIADVLADAERSGLFQMKGHARGLAVYSADR